MHAAFGTASCRIVVCGSACRDVAPGGAEVSERENQRGPRGRRRDRGKFVCRAAGGRRCGDAILESQNGEITAHGVTGAVSAKTSFARISFDGDGKRLRCAQSKRLGANHRALIRRGANRRDHIVRPIDVSLPHDCKPLIRANTSFGKVRSEFPIV